MSKLAGRHASFTEAAELVRQFLTTLPEVTGISPGVISHRKRGASGIISVKITASGGVLCLGIARNRSFQEVRIYTSNHDETIKRLTAYGADEGWRLRTR